MVPRHREPGEDLKTHKRIASPAQVSNKVVGVQEAASLISNASLEWRSRCHVCFEMKSFKKLRNTFIGGGTELTGQAWSSMLQLGGKMTGIYQGRCFKCMKGALFQLQKSCFQLTTEEECVQASRAREFSRVRGSCLCRLQATRASLCKLLGSECLNELLLRSWRCYGAHHEPGHAVPACSLRSLHHQQPLVTEPNELHGSLYSLQGQMRNAWKATASWTYLVLLWTKRWGFSLRSRSERQKQMRARNRTLL